jgi:glycosyltransferase involved in cell wall biosynthesis
LLRKATKTIPASQTTERDLMNCLRIPEGPTRAVYEGIDHTVFRSSAQSSSFRYLYILLLGSEHRRKNLPTSIRTLGKLKERRQFKHVKLAKVGKAGRKGADFRKQIMEVMASLNLDGEVTLSEFVSEENSRACSCGAECSVLSWLHEGFGFPPPEAIACRGSVITSDSSSLTEVVAGAAIKVSREDVDRLAEALQKAPIDKQLKKNLQKRWMAQASKFTWEQAARKTLNAYKEVEKELR